MSKTIALQVRYKSLYISLPSFAKLEREMTKFCVVYRTWTTTANFSYFHLELNRTRQSQISLVKYKFIFYLASSSASSSSLLKLPIIGSLIGLTRRAQNGKPGHTNLLIKAL